jgi:hypothetical protein
MNLINTKYENVNKIVPGTWVSGDWDFLLYQYPEDAIYTFLKWLPLHMRHNFFVGLFKELTQQKKLIHSVLSSMPSNNGIEEMEGKLLPNWWPNEFEDIISSIIGGPTVAAAESNALRVAGNNKITSTQENTQVKIDKFLKKFVKIRRSTSMDKWQKDKACMSAVNRLACHGLVTHTVCYHNMLVVDRIEILSIPLIKVLFSKNDETKMGWITLLPVVLRNLNIVKLSELMDQHE